MQQSHIRIARTPEVSAVLAYLQTKYRLLSESDIIKLALSEKYRVVKDQHKQTDKDVAQLYASFMQKGRKIGEELIKKSGIQKEQLSEEELYTRFIEQHEKRNSA